MSNEPGPTEDEVYASESQRQQAEDHDERAARTTTAPEIVESLRSHDETDAHLPADEREHIHGVDSPATA